MPLSYQDLVRKAKEQIIEVEPAELEPRLEQRSDFLVIDVREIDEFEQGAIQGSRHIPRGLLESTIGNHVPNPETEIILYCAAGARSALAARSLQEMGYSNVRSMRGGFGSWKSGGHSWSTPVTLSSEQRSRYSRHILLPEVGEEGQHKLLDAKILLIGAGGLGSPAALYLAAAGVGTVGIVDFDQVDTTNLQRQILHNVDRVGQSKVESARETITALNPDVKVEPFTQRLSAENVIEVLSGYDVVVDGADNFPTRYLLNDASLHLRIPVVHGSVFRFEGQATVFDPYNGPCYRCLFPEPPPPELAPSCAEAGVLGVLPGIIGSIEAMEAIKIVLGIGDSLVGRLLIYDALDEEFRTVRLRRHPSCPACSDESHPPRLVEYDDLCLPGGNVERATSRQTL